MKLFIEKVVSGGQTGADRAGLEAARAAGIKTGGFCPKDYMTENGRDITLKDFGLVQTKTEDYNERTFLNVMHSDGTVIFSKTDKAENVIGTGTLLTVNTATSLGKSYLINPGKKEFVEWVVSNNIRTLNVAGNRRSQNRNIYRIVYNFLKTNLLIPTNIDGKDTKVYKKLESDILSIKNNRMSGSVTLLNKLIEAITKYVKNTKVHSSIIYKNIKRNTTGFKEGDTVNMTVLNGFADKFLREFKETNKEKDEKKKYLDYLADYKKKWKDVSKKISANAIKEIDFNDKTIVLFSNSSSVVSVFQALAKKGIFPGIIQCESNPEREGVVQAKTLRGLGFKVKVINEEDINNFTRKIDFGVLGCDAYNNSHFINKRGTYDLVIKLGDERIPVYVMSDSRKYTKKYFKRSGKKDKSMFERIPLRMVTKVINEQIAPTKQKRSPPKARGDDTSG